MLGAAFPLHPADPAFLDGASRGADAGKRGRPSAHVLPAARNAPLRHVRQRGAADRRRACGFGACPLPALSRGDSGQDRGIPGAAPSRLRTGSRGAGPPRANPPGVSIPRRTHALRTRAPHGLLIPTSLSSFHTIPGWYPRQVRPLRTRPAAFPCARSVRCAVSS